MIWGETGTRSSATHYQLTSVAWLWSRYGITMLHNGDCVGVDEQLYYLGRAFKANMVIHPPTKPLYRAYVGDNLDIILPEKEYLDRDRDVVNESEVLVACTMTTTEQERSGTWYTINYARSLKHPIAIVWPNGRITYENWITMEEKS